MNIESLCLQNDQRHENGTHSVPIYPSSTFTFDSAEQGMRQFKGEEPGYIYSRWNNPTTEALALKLEQLETFGLGIKSKAWVCSSGMGALSTLFLSTLKAGEKVLSHYSLYGGTEDLLQKVLPDLGIQHQIIDFKDLNRVEEVIKAMYQSKWFILKPRLIQPFDVPTLRPWQKLLIAMVERYQ